MLHLRPAGSFEATAYLDWEDKTGGKDQITYAGFLGLSGKAFHGGIEGFLRTNKDPERGDVKVKGLSVFGAGRVRPTAKLFSRLDLYDPSDRTSEDGEILFIGGIDLVPVEDVHIMPNVIITTFQAPEMDAEVMPRITLYTKF